MRLYLAYFNLVACDLVPFDSNFETECKLFTQHLVLDNDFCINRNVGRTKINLVTSNNLYEKIHHVVPLSALLYSVCTFFLHIDNPIVVVTQGSNSQKKVALQ